MSYTTIASPSKKMTTVSVKQVIKQTHQHVNKLYGEFYVTPELLVPLLLQGKLSYLIDSERRIYFNPFVCNRHFNIDYPTVRLEKDIERLYLDHPNEMDHRDERFSFNVYTLITDSRFKFISSKNIENCFYRKQTTIQGLTHAIFYALTRDYEFSRNDVFKKNNIDTNKFETGTVDTDSIKVRKPLIVDNEDKYLLVSKDEHLIYYENPMQRAKYFVWAQPPSQEEEGEEIVDLNKPLLRKRPQRPCDNEELVPIKYGTSIPFRLCDYFLSNTHQEYYKMYYPTN